MPRRPPRPLSDQERLLNARLLEVWRRLCDRMDALRTAITVADAHLPAYVAPAHTGQAARRAALLLYGPMQHTSRTPGDATTSHAAGLLCASARTLTIARELNEAKAALRQTLTALPRDIQPYCLAQKRIARLHRKQAYRQIPVLDPPPRRVYWCLSRKNAQYRPVDPALLAAELAEQADLPMVAEDIARLRSVPAGYRLVEVRPGAVYIVNNLRYPDGRMRTRNCSIPLLVAGDRLPDYEPFALFKADYRAPRRKRRRDAQVEDTPYLACRKHIYLRRA